MQKKELSDILNGLLVQIGFKKKGNNWIKNEITFAKIVNLQKSNFSNVFYINYGYIINSLPLDGMRMHIYNRVSSNNESERIAIVSLLDLDNQISDEERANALKIILQDCLVSKLLFIQTETDLREQLKTRPHLNDIVPAVKKYLKL